MLLSKARLMGPLPAMAQTRLLGVTVDQNLSWIPHLQEVVRSFANKLSLLKKSNQGFYPVMCASRFILRLSSCQIDHFHCHATKKQIGNRPVEEAKKMKCYKQFFQVSGLCGPQFLSYLPKRFTRLCRAWYGDAILVDPIGPPIWPPEINKTIWSSLFL